MLDIIDVFGLWAAIATGIALAAPARLGKGATIAVSLVVYLLLMGVGNGLRMLQ